MLSYQHGYHAGNFADVHKHAVLSLVLNYLRRKPKPFTVFDLYAGRGRYDLQSVEAQKTGEAALGILRQWQQPWPELLGDYRHALRALNPQSETLRWYPGSPLITELLTRDGTDLVLCELHPQEFAALQHTFTDHSRVHLHRRDALEAVQALLPPMSRRGLVLIDPSYERAGDYDAVTSAVLRGTERWANGVYLLWYPLLADGRHQKMLRRLCEAGLPWLRSEVRVRPGGMGMSGSGLLLLNPPYLLPEQLRSLAGWFAPLGQGAAASLDIFVSEHF
jgi:23S rRNA (adenine2030-N6)-methyltransferase